MSKSRTRSNRRPSALLMAVYTFLLALGAALPLAASYSGSVDEQPSEREMRGGAYQPQDEVSASADEKSVAAPILGDARFDGAEAPAASIDSELDGVSHRGSTDGWSLPRGS